MLLLPKPAYLFAALTFFVGCGSSQSERDADAAQQVLARSRNSPPIESEDDVAADSMASDAGEFDDSTPTNQVPRTITEQAMERLFEEYREDTFSHWRFDVDLNGDHLSDALYNDACGQQLCSSSVYLREPSGSFTYVGESASSVRNDPIICTEGNGSAVVIELFGRHDWTAIKQRVSFSGIEHLEMTTYRVDYPDDSDQAVYNFEKESFLPEGCSVE